MSDSETETADRPQTPRGTGASRRATASGEARERLELVRQLVLLFELERRVYLTIVVLSLLCLLTSVLFLLVRTPSNGTELLGILGSSGGIMYSAGRILRMFNEALRVVMQMESSGGDQ